jgi:hypothetical protein
MVMNKVCFLVVILGFLGCKSEQEKMLIGNWQGIELTQNDSIINVDFNKVHLLVDDNDNYKFESTLNYMETGIYKLKNKNQLFLKKLNLKPAEKMVKIDYISYDTLVLLLNHKGYDQVLTMVKMKK